ncbi:MAG TPA: tRNA glutamyl-Q(34) synthetase GluQRS [Sphingomicrobium sp.]
MIVTRFAPSPTGRLHLGHAYSAILGSERARECGGKFLLRIEDLDRTRSRPEFVDGIIEDLGWLGIEWTEPVLVQSRRAVAYDEALEKLRDKGLVYPCFCTRSDIAAALEAPHGSSAHYPGTCRGLGDDRERRASTPHSWRLDSAKALEIAGLPSWTEADGEQFTSARGDFDDVILARKDAPAAYHLACVVDDATSGVTLVTRAIDLRSSTPIQRLLQELLGLPEPSYLHHPIVAHADGRRLAKRDFAPTLAAMREEGVNGRGLAGELAEGKLPLGFTFVDA